MGIVLDEGLDAVEIFHMSCEAGIRKEFRMLLEPMHHHGTDIVPTNMRNGLT
jgi:hypothetical protein